MDGERSPLLDYRAGPLSAAEPLFLSPRRHLSFDTGDDSAPRGKGHGISISSSSGGGVSAASLYPPLLFCGAMSCLKKTGATGDRTVEANDAAASAKFVDNTITNTKYTVLTFVPLNLMEQFS